MDRASRSWSGYAARRVHGRHEGPSVVSVAGAEECMSKMLAPALAMKAAETRKGRGVGAEDDGDADEERVLSAAGAAGM